MTAPRKRPFMRGRRVVAAIVGVSLAACAPAPTAPPAAVSWNGLTFEAASAVTTPAAPAAPVPVVRTTVTVRNTTAEPVVLHHGACVVLIRLYRAPARAGAPAWDQGPNSVCVAIALSTRLAAGADTTFSTGARVRELGDAGLRAGRYYVSAVVRLDVGASVDAETVLSAGEVELPGS